MSQTASRKRIFRSFFSIFELGSITKHLMTGSAGNSESRPSMRVSCKQKSVSLGASQTELVHEILYCMKMILQPF